ncbi:universal stress protein [Isoptericola sp. S6320L]|uniref:universal stress protein n=1 Tax=Isoptericola sp. S6320L TaxID=2926411 RepID=UPI001FF2F0A4|nr:universal stress protein [Isoptericola sp. S6320L]MCK0116525.1 universal stress protein [Isoptericola sp. S6320L]
MSERHGVVVGVDGSTDSDQALYWAAAEAVRRRTTLTVLTTYDVTTVPGSAGYGIGPDAMRDEATVVVGRAAERLAKAREECAGQVPEADDISWETVRGSAAGVLVEHSATSALLVVGRRGLNAFDRVVLGSVSAVLSARARGPVAIVPFDPVAAATACPGDVVGAVWRVAAAVDFDDHLERVLDIAFEEAQHAGVPLLLVHALHSEFIAGPYAMDTAWVHEYAEEATARLHDELSRWEQKYPTVPTTIEMARGSIVDVLTRRLSRHDLVVVGGRPHAPILGRIFRSDADRLGRDVECPILVAHEQR